MPAEEGSRGKHSRPSAAAPARHKPAARLTAASDFARLYGCGKSYSHKLLRMCCAASETGTTRIGYVAGRRVGSAVARNRAKRLMREAARGLPDLERGPQDIVFVAHRPILDSSADDVRGAMRKLLQRARAAGEQR